MTPKKYKILSIIILLTWFGFILFVILDNLGVWGSSITPIDTLKTSTFARSMFVDIGILSTIIAGWMVFCTTLRSRYVFALVTLFVGSFAFLPFLSLYFYHKSKNND